MKTIKWFFCILLFAHLAVPLSMRIEDKLIELPDGWKLHQETQSNEVQLLGFENKKKYLQVYVIQEKEPNQKNFLDFTKTKLLMSEAYLASSGFEWELKKLEFKNSTTQVGIGTKDSLKFVVIFRNAESGDFQELKQILNRLRYISSDDRSLTGPDFSGRKFYLGFGDNLSGFMGNEVKYDIAHTHDVFTTDAGGDYDGVKVIGKNQGEQELIKEWESIGKVMNDKDMFVQYSSGHGSKTGLAFGPSYKEIRDNALSYPAKEIIIFTMACYSGNLVDMFNQKKADWENWNQQGRTLWVMASSQPSQTSSTGPGHDPLEPGGPAGSAGSAFGHALWKALIGYSDGEVDGIRDRFLSIDEIREFTKRRTREVGGHTPVNTGSYNGNLLIAKVPSRQWLLKMNQGTQGLSDSQIAEQIRGLDNYLGK